MRIKNTVVGALVVSVYAVSASAADRDGLVEYHGRQASIVGTGKADGTLPITAMSGASGAYGVGAYEGLDGEITIFGNKPYVTKVRGDGFIMDNSGAGKAIFGAWTKHADWRDEPVPADVKTYLDLQRFVKARADAAGIDTAKTPFPFLMTGAPAEIKWHINVDRTGGKPVDAELFKKSKVNYVMKGEDVNIVGFYSEKHHGAFIGTYSPAITEKDVKNAIHIHMVSKDSKAAGHIDHITLAGGMTLRLPKQ